MDCRAFLKNAVDSLSTMAALFVRIIMAEGVGSMAAQFMAVRKQSREQSPRGSSEGCDAKF